MIEYSTKLSRQLLNKKKTFICDMLEKWQQIFMLSTKVLVVHT